MNGDAGKGDKWRKNFDFQRYWKNSDNIQRIEPSKMKKKKLRGGKVRYTFS